MKNLSDFNFKDRRVLLRVDINSEVINGKIFMNERIKQAAISIKKLLKEKAKVVVIAHQGNPGKKDFINLKQHYKLLKKLVKIKFVEDIIGKKSIEKISQLKSGSALLLDNIRFIEDEFHPEKPDNILIKTLTPLFDYYVNDAFSVCHRNHTSIVSFPKHLKSCAGLFLEKELKALKKISIENCLYILGGAKPEENIKLLNSKKVLACGLFGQLCLVASGKNLGYQNDFLRKSTLINEDYDKFLEKLKNKISNVEMPLDFAVEKNGKREEYSLDEFPLPYEIQDIGEKTIKKFKKIIKNSPAIYMKGPAGNTEKKIYMKGTIELLKAISKSKGFSLIGGGHLSKVISESKIPVKKFGHVSLAGGALLNYIAGEKLIGLEVLN